MRSLPDVKGIFMKQLRAPDGSPGSNPSSTTIPATKGACRAWFPLARASALLLVCTATLTAQTFEAFQKRRFASDRRGEIHITSQAIEFKAIKEKNSRRWTYEDIQYFDRISEKEFSILSYEDQKWRLGRDRQYHFVLTAGTLDDALFQSISTRIGRPVTNRLVKRVQDSRYKLAVKHLHGLGGCEGELIFTDDAILYKTEHRKDAREWRVTRDVESVWSSNPYHLELHVHDNNRREFSRTRVYKFDLKQPLDQDFYLSLKLRMHGLATGR